MMHVLDSLLSHIMIASTRTKVGAMGGRKDKGGRNEHALVMWETLP